MVTTTSLNGDLNFKTDVLFQSELAEDRQIAEMAGQQISALVDKLVPVLVYVDQQIGETRGIEVVKDGDRILVLGREGTWYSGAVGEKLTQTLTGWRYYLLSEIVKGLEEAFTKAIATKAIHLAAVEKRQDLLNKVGAVIRGESVPAAEK